MTATLILQRSLAFPQDRLGDGSRRVENGAFGGTRASTILSRRCIAALVLVLGRLVPHGLYCLGARRLRLGLRCAVAACVGPVVRVRTSRRQEPYGQNGETRHRSAGHIGHLPSPVGDAVSIGRYLF